MTRRPECLPTVTTRFAQNSTPEQHQWVTGPQSKHRTDSGTPSSPVSTASDTAQTSALQPLPGHNYPPQTGMSKLTQDDLDQAAHSLNTRPRQTLGGMTPPDKPAERLR